MITSLNGFFSILDSFYIEHRISRPFHIFRKQTSFNKSSPFEIFKLISNVLNRTESLRALIIFVIYVEGIENRRNNQTLLMKFIKVDKLH